MGSTLIVIDDWGPVDWDKVVEHVKRRRSMSIRVIKVDGTIEPLEGDNITDAFEHGRQLFGAGYVENTFAIGPEEEKVGMLVHESGRILDPPLPRNDTATDMHLMACAPAARDKGRYITGDAIIYPFEWYLSTVGP